MRTSIPAPSRPGLHRGVEPHLPELRLKAGGGGEDVAQFSDTGLASTLLPHGLQQRQRGADALQIAFIAVVAIHEA